MELHPIALGAIIAAVITGLLSLLGLIISKEQKTSEFRQQWIDCLRNDIAELLGNIESAIQHIRAIKNDINAQPSAGVSNSVVFERIKGDIREAERLYHQILLRINPDEHKKISDILEEMREEFNKGDIPSPEEFHKLEQKLIKITQSILKKEWNRVKDGEPAFKIAKYVSIIFILTVLVIGIYGAVST